MHDPILQFINDNPKSYLRLLTKSNPDLVGRVSEEGVGVSLPEKFFNHLKTDNTQPNCYCGAKTKFLNFQKGYRQFCSSKCRANSREQKDMTAKTNIEKYGSAAYTSSKSFREKAVTTFMSRYGVSNPMKHDAIKMVVKNEIIKRYGVSCGFLIPAARERYKAENGVSNPMQLPANFEKQQASSYRIKSFVTPAGRIIKCRGYEPILLSRLFEQFNDADIICSTAQMPRIWYRNSAKQRDCKYYPDVFIPSLNLILEVKSEYTIKSDLIQNYEKRDACLMLGFNFAFVVCDKDSILRIEGFDLFQQTAT